MTSTKEDVASRLPRRQQLLGIAGELFYKRGFHGTGVDEIGEAAGITGPALYRHFANKQAVLDALCVEGMERLLRHVQTTAEIGGDADEKLDRLIRARIDFAFGPDRYAFVVHRNEHRNLSESARRRIIAMEDMYRSEWMRVMAFLRPGASTAVLQRALYGAHILIGYVALDEHVDDAEAVRSHIAKMAQATLLA